MINKYFNNPFTVNRWDWSSEELFSSDIASKLHTYTTAWTYKVVLSLTGWYTRWTFKDQNCGDNCIALVDKRYTTVTNVKITSMPSLSWYFGASATNPGNNFFNSFN